MTSEEKLTKTVTPAVIEELYNQKIAPYLNGEAHADYFRMKDITDEYYNGNLKAEIAAGNFLNVHPGDYIIGKTTGTKYWVAECDHWFNKGDTAMTTHHLTIIPYQLMGVSTLLWAGRTQNGGTTSNTTQGMCPWSVASGQNPQSTTAQGQNVTMAYVNSWIKTTALARYYNEWLKADFDTADVLSFRNLLGNNYDANCLSAGHPAWKGATTGWAWADSYCDLMSEVEIYGSTVWGSSGFDVGCQRDQLAMFKLAGYENFFPRMTIWLKAVVSSSVAASCGSDGLASSGAASRVFWLCPLANIK